MIPSCGIEGGALQGLSARADVQTFFTCKPVPERRPRPSGFEVHTVQSSEQHALSKMLSVLREDLKL